VPEPLLSLPWIEAYRERWNTNERAMNGTKGLDMIVELGVTDADGRPPVQLHIRGEDGVCDYAGPVQAGKKATFRLNAPTETWRKVAKGEMGVKRAVTGPVKFQGSLVNAMKHFDGLEAALQQFGDVPTQEWDG
jgi:putative sterol carrier protein